MIASALQEAPEPPSGTTAGPPSSSPVLPSQKASHAERMRQAKADLRAVPERDLVQAIDRWLDGGPWEGRDWIFAPGRGLAIRLLEDGDDLTVDGVAIVSRHPVRLRDIPEGSRTSRRQEARALAAVAVRGDAGWYDGKPRKKRDRAGLVWTGFAYVHAL